MTNRLKIAQLKAKRSAKRREAIESIGNKIDNLEIPEVEVSTEKLEQAISSIEPIVVPAPDVKVDNSGLAKSIVELRQAFAIVKAAIDQDIYARYAYTNSAEANSITYIGYLATDGKWFIQRIASGSRGESSLFYTDDGDYTAGWANRLSHEYVLRSEVNL